MSSTKRGYDRHANDKYFTPRWLADEAAEIVKRYIPTANLSRSLPPGGRMNILEPAVGSGVIVQALNESLNCDGIVANVEHFDLDPTDGFDTVKQDFFEFSKTGWDVIITNPPYRLAQEFVEHSLSLVKEGGVVMMLLRLNFLGGQKRRHWHWAHMPESIYVTPKRPKFFGVKGTDSCEYAWFVWRRGINNDYAKTYVLDTGNK